MVILEFKSYLDISNTRDNRVLVYLDTVDIRVQVYLDTGDNRVHVNLDTGNDNVQIYLNTVEIKRCIVSKNILVKMSDD